mmetsp:Transcript_7919/g.31773  ORF Transcript_7919/g.31773 Transcript_7919/m.31773 type:complete len:216 (+) Transcript_7919:591-1238(+)
MSLLSPRTSIFVIPSSTALRNPKHSAAYSASFTVRSFPKYSNNSSTIRSSRFLRSSAPAPASPGFPRLAPSNSNTYSSSLRSSFGAFAALASARTRASIPSSASSPARVDIPRPPEVPRLRALTFFSITRASSLADLALSVASPSRIPSSSRVASTVRAVTPPSVASSPRCASRYARASSSVANFLCIAPPKFCTCFFASSHVVYTPRARPRATA